MIAITLNLTSCDDDELHVLGTQGWVGIVYRLLCLFSIIHRIGNKDKGHRWAIIDSFKALSKSERSNWLLGLVIQWLKLFSTVSLLCVLFPQAQITTNLKKRKKVCSLIFPLFK